MTTTQTQTKTAQKLEAARTADGGVKTRFAGYPAVVRNVRWDGSRRTAAGEPVYLCEVEFDETSDAARAELARTSCFRLPSADGYTIRRSDGRIAAAIIDLLAAE